MQFDVEIIREIVSGSFMGLVMLLSIIVVVVTARNKPLKQARELVQEWNGGRRELEELRIEAARETAERLSRANDAMLQALKGTQEASRERELLMEERWQAVNERVDRMNAAHRERTEELEGRVERLAAENATLSKALEAAQAQIGELRVEVAKEREARLAAEAGHEKAARERDAALGEAESLRAKVQDLEKRVEDVERDLAAERKRNGVTGNISSDEDDALEDGMQSVQKDAA